MKQASIEKLNKYQDEYPESENLISDLKKVAERHDGKIPQLFTIDGAHYTADQIIPVLRYIGYTDLEIKVSNFIFNQCMVFIDRTVVTMG